jgi:hypothetical protein
LYLRSIAGDLQNPSSLTGLFLTGCETKQDVIFGLAGQYRSFHQSAILMSSSSSSVIPFILADIGKGITEVQIIQW